MEKYLPEIKMKNKSVLKFKLPWDMGNQSKWWRTKLDPGMFKKINKKERHPILGLWSSGTNQHIIAVDLDFHGNKPFTDEQLKWKLLSCAHNIGNLITKSVSGNIRMLLAVQCENEITEDIAWDFLINTIHKDLHPYMDKKGMSRMYVNAEVYQEIGEWLQTAIYHPIGYTLPNAIKGPRITGTGNEGNGTTDGVKAGGSSNIVVTKVSNTYKTDTAFQYKQYNAPLPAWAKKWVAKKEVHEVRETLLRILMAAWRLIDENKGFDLPTTKLAEACNTTPKAISLLLKELQKDGLLVCRHAGYIPGKHSKSYYATKELKQTLVSMRYEFSQPNMAAQGRPSAMLASRAIEGEWYTECLRASAKFKGNKAAFDSWLNSIPNLGRAGRSLAERVWKCDTRKVTLGMTNKATRP